MDPVATNKYHAQWDDEEHDQKHDIICYRVGHCETVLKELCQIERHHREKPCKHLGWKLVCQYAKEVRILKNYQRCIHWLNHNAHHIVIRILLRDPLKVEEQKLNALQHCHPLYELQALKVAPQKPNREYDLNQRLENDTHSPLVGHPVPAEVVEARSDDGEDNIAEHDPFQDVLLSLVYLPAYLFTVVLLGLPLHAVLFAF